MEMLVIAIIVVAASAAVLIPLFRRRPGVGDDREVENIPTAEEIAAQEAARHTEPIPQEELRTDGSAADTTGSVTSSDVTGSIAPDANGAIAPDGGSTSDGADTLDEIEVEIMRYRAALRAGTLCRKCGQASPDGSRFCFECGSRLPHADAREFE